MGKADELRALREARWEREHSGKVSTPSSLVKQDLQAIVKEASSTAKKEKYKPEPPKQTSDMCGHAGMSGKKCTRPMGHTERNHRYS